VSHPALGLPPEDLTAGLPEAAARLGSNADRLAARALGIAIEADPTVRERYDEAGLRHLLHDAGVLLERVARSVASGDVRSARDFAEQSAVVYRRRRVPMDDLIALSEGLRRASESVLAPAERPAADAAIDAAIERFRWHRRIAGDARKRNRILAAIYKGA
jgi:hypothetical protein